MRDPYFFENDPGQTSFTISPSFSVNQETVLLNGSHLSRDMGGVVRDYYLSGVDDEMNTITLNTPLIADDVLEVRIVDTLEVDTINAKLDDIMTAVVGSWIWDKSSGIMTMVDNSGNERFKFSVKDDSESSSRERRSDLEL